MGKTSKTARQVVNDKLEEASKSTSQNSSKAPVTPSKSTSKSKNLSIISAAAAVYRSQNAPQEKPFTPSAEQQKIFAETQKKLADEKGISANDLSPLDIMKSATFDYYKETQNNDTASNDVQAEIAEVYDNNPENPEPAPEAITSVNKNVNITFIPDFEFLTLNEDQQKKYLESISEHGAEKDHLEKLLEDNKKEPDYSDEDKTASFDKGDDPDGPTANKDDYKSEKGDIIDWMMNKVIMEGVDWLGNRTVDLTTGIVYGSAYVIYKGAKKGWKSYKKSKEEEKQIRAAKAKNAKEMTDVLEKEKNETIPPRIPSEDELSFVEGFLGNRIFLEDDHFIKDGKKCSYDTIDVDSKEPGKVDKFKACIGGYNVMLASLVNSELNPTDDSQIKEDIKKWIFDSQKELHEATKNGTTPKDIEIPESLKNAGITPDKMNNSVEESKNKIIAYARARPIIDQMEYNSEIFSINYAQYKMAEMARNPQDGNNAEKLKDIQLLRKTLLAEGKNFMYQNYEALRNGDPKAVSPEELVQSSQKMAKKSKELLDKNDSKTKSPDLLKGILKTQKQNPEPKSLQDFTFDDVIDIELNNLAILNKEEQILNNQQNTNDKKRALIEEIKARHDLIDKQARTQSVDNLKRFVKEKSLNEKKATNPNILPKKENKNNR